MARSNGRGSDVLVDAPVVEVRWGAAAHVDVEEAPEIERES